MKALLLRDLRLALRSGGGFGLGLAFFFLLSVLVPLGVGPEGGMLGRIAPGVLWVGALLACLLSLDRIFALDHEDGSLDLLATAPIPLEAVVAVKAFAHWLVTGLPLTLIAPGLAVLLNLPPAGYSWLVLSLLVLPLYVPTLIFGGEVVRRGAEGMALATPLALLGAISLGTAALLPFAAASAIRVNLR